MKILVLYLLITSVLFVFSPIMFLNIIIGISLSIGWFISYVEEKDSEESTNDNIPRCQECGRPLETDHEKEVGYCFNCEVEDEAIATIS